MRPQFKSARKAKLEIAALALSPRDDHLTWEERRKRRQHAGLSRNAFIKAEEKSHRMTTRDATWQKLHWQGADWKKKGRT